MATTKKPRTRKAPARTETETGDKPRCGLCGKGGRLMKTDCCQQWICDDEANYKMFSYARNSCARNHRRYTLCGSHAAEGHPGDWKTCTKCRADFETEMYVYYGTNEFNFTKLENPPSYEPTRCHSCNEIIRLGYEGYSQGAEGYTCEACLIKQNPHLAALMR